jgi:ATP/maltotriose-dependent transcriptional regulator MalT
VKTIRRMEKAVRELDNNIRKKVIEILRSEVAIHQGERIKRKRGEEIEREICKRQKESKSKSDEKCESEN